MSELSRVDIRWPVVMVTSPRDPSLRCVEHFCEQLDEIFARERPFVTIHDMSPTRRLINAQGRKIIVDFIKENRLRIARWHVASATIVPSPMVRGIITAVHWFAKPPSPLIATGSLEESVAFVLRHLDQKGVAHGFNVEWLVKELGRPEALERTGSG